MDSITQIVLGAAVGEAAIGKKVGNRALLWGGVAGTIPDLDVISNLFLSEINALAFHRGFTHSIVFAILGAFVFGWLVDWMYRSKFHRFFGTLGWSLLFGAIGFSLYSIFTPDEGIKWTGLILSGLALFFIFYRIYNRYIEKEYSLPSARLSDWQKLFFWSVFTHPILDSYTVYGTQLFQPFSDYRVGFNNISVADPLYTVPFLLCVVIVAFLRKGSRARSIINWIGIIVSSLYLLFTFTNKFKVDQVFKSTLAEEHVDYKRYMTAPTILNNVLWYCCAETDSSYVFGQYSLLDEEKRVDLNEVSKNHHLLGEVKEDDRTIEILKWFSNNYYNVLVREDGDLQFNDLRYGTFYGKPGSERDYIFHFPIRRDENGYYQLQNVQGGPPDDVDTRAMMKALWQRINGNKNAINQSGS